jgi:hypothetical protein
MEGVLAGNAVVEVAVAAPAVVVYAEDADIAGGTFL